MELLDIAAVGVVISLAALVQATVGFGVLLFATPLIVWIGIPLPAVITMVATCSTIQAAFGVRELGPAVPWRLSWTATGIRLFSMIIGLFLLKQLAILNTDYIKLVVGSIVCLLITVKFLFKSHAVEKSHWAWAGLAFIVSGLLGGLCGMGGAPLILWAMAHNWSTEKTRGFLFGVLATSIPVQIVLMSLTFGLDILWYVAIGIAFLPLTYLGLAVGLPIGGRMSKQRLRLIIDVILLVIGISTVAGPVFTRLQ